MDRRESGEEEISGNEKEGQEKGEGGKEVMKGRQRSESQNEKASATEMDR